MAIERGIFSTRLSLVLELGILCSVFGFQSAAEVVEGDFQRGSKEIEDKRQVSGSQNFSTPVTVAVYPRSLRA